MYAFISYAYEDRKTANNVKECLKKMGINSFMAHDDINVSSEWVRNILEEIKKADIKPPTRCLQKIFCRLIR